MRTGAPTTATDSPSVSQRRLDGAVDLAARPGLAQLERRDRHLHELAVALEERAALFGVGALDFGREAVDVEVARGIGFVAEHGPRSSSARATRRPAQGRAIGAALFGSRSPAPPRRPNPSGRAG